jgi:hypothetical protein
MSMQSRVLRFAVAPVLVLAATAAAVAGDVTRARADADQMLRKMAVVAANGERTQPAAQRTAFTEREVNAFLVVHAREAIPAGVVDPIVTIGEGGRLSGRAIVDLDQVREAARATGGGFSMVHLLSGRVPVEAHGVLSTTNGVGRFDLQTATVGGVPIPKTVLQEVITYYSRGPENPEGIDLDAPFELPAGIRQITTQKGQAIVLQ